MSKKKLNYGTWMLQPYKDRPPFFMDKNDLMEALFESVKTLERTSALLNKQPLYSSRKNVELMKGWDLAMRHLKEALDGEQ